jgi:hypothetical protein
MTEEGVIFIAALACVVVFDCVISRIKKRAKKAMKHG